MSYRMSWTVDKTFLLQLSWYANAEMLERRNNWKLQRSECWDAERKEESMKEERGRTWREDAKSILHVWILHHENLFHWFPQCFSPPNPTKLVTNFQCIVFCYLFAIFLLLHVLPVFNVAHNFWLSLVEWFQDAKWENWLFGYIHSWNCIGTISQAFTFYYPRFPWTFVERLCTHLKTKYSWIWDRCWYRVRIDKSIEYGW